MFWLESYFSKIKKPNSHFLKNHRGIAGIRNQLSRHNKKNDTTAQLYCTLSTYVTPKTISRQNQKN
jgi:hypothetical protein